MEITKLLRIIGFISYPLILLGSLYKLLYRRNVEVDSNKSFEENKKEKESKINNKSFFMPISFIATVVGIIYYFINSED